MALMVRIMSPHSCCFASQSPLSLGGAGGNKEKVSKVGGIEPLVKLSRSDSIPVRIEAIAALANLAVNGRARQPACKTDEEYMSCSLFSCVDANEIQIAEAGGLEPIVQSLHSENEELLSQAARAIRNLSVNGKRNASQRIRPWPFPLYRFVVS